MTDKAPLFPRLLMDEALELEVRSKWFSEHVADASVYQMDDEGFYAYIEAWVNTHWPDHDAKLIAPAIWLNKPVLMHHHRVSNTLAARFKRLFQLPKDGRQ